MSPVHLSLPDTPNLLSSLLVLTTDSVFVFDRAGSLLAANDEALWLASLSSDRLGSLSVQDIFLTSEQRRVSPPDLPFSSDGVGCTAYLLRPDGTHLAVGVRCERVQGAQGTSLAVVRPLDEASTYLREHDRLLSELSRTNHRLAGTLRVVLDTLEATDLPSLFHLVLEELRDTMDATGAVVYFSDAGGFHLGGVSSSLEGLQVPSYLAHGSRIPVLATKAGGTLRLRLLNPTTEELRGGGTCTRGLFDEDAREALRVPSDKLPPFVSFYCVPVWYGERLIAFIELGWDKQHPTSRDDARLLEAVSQYLSVQFMSALTAHTLMRQAALNRLANSIHDDLVRLKDPPDATLYRRYLGLVSSELDCLAVVAEPDGDAGMVVARGSDAEVRFRVGESPRYGVRVDEVAPSEPVGAALQDAGLPCAGALLDVGELFGRRRVVLFVRSAERGPFEPYELDFLRNLGELVCDAAVAARERRSETRISQALQMGMRNALQEVDGLFAEGIYSSATASAYVGGDFYDLVKLPEGRACVLLGDVSGHGVEAASVAAAVRTAVEAYSWEGVAPARMCTLLNDFLLGLGKLETFATLFVGVMEVEKGVLRYCSAGHPPALLLRAASGDIEALGVQSGAVGAFPEMVYRDGEVRLSPGDALLLYTDGATEARAADGTFFGEDGLRDAVARESEGGLEGLVGRLLADLDAFTGRRLTDDVALVCLRYDG